jgi:hypothetical protein
MTYYDSFDCKINCEEVETVSEEEREEVFRLIAEENEAMQGFEAYLESLEESERQALIEQAAFDIEQTKAKAFNWSKRDPQEVRLNGVAI